jgi:alanyl-tRNA synthetase
VNMMKTMKSAEIRQAFCEYFEKLGHQVVPTSSLVPAQDPTLLFTNAGMVQFKDVFLGTEHRSYRRAVSVQRCVRAGGKHNDLENVGFTSRHHTFFEMLGNFSFGDYFKKDAIRMAWSFLTEVLALPKDKLWVTVYEEDLESEKIWLEEMGVSPKRLTRCGAKDNFWAMGDTGPCGPCTEIYFDHGEHIAGGPPGSPDMDGDRYVEIWNVVFMQYNRDPEGKMHPLPKPSVDTGMGLERIAAVMQGVNSNYDTDIFVHLRKAITQLAPNIDKTSPSVLVVADHIRSCCFLIADGVMPSNEGRGYVLRRIIRRAIRHGHQLGLPTPFMHQLVPALAEVMGQAYPELIEQKAHIQQLLKLEEEQFMRTISQGLKLLKESLAECHDKCIPGDVVFKLYDTYGFPVDLTADAAREAGYDIDAQGFEVLMQQQRQQSQANAQFQSDYLALPTDVTSTVFQGYETTEYSSKVKALYHDHQVTSRLDTEQAGLVILLETPFYAESGGQVGDQGLLVGPHGEFVVTDTQKKGEMILHLGYVSKGFIAQNEHLQAHVDNDKRQAIRLNHTATHILHAALRSILGSSVQQKGSLVNVGRTRFDFSFNRALTLTEVEAVECWVNDKIRQNAVVQTDLLSLEQAQARGAMALFGEKYSEQVRVLSMGEFSQELCGGTHVRQTGEIGVFKILTESSIASGVRRIEFVTGSAAIQDMQQQTQAMDHLAKLMKTSPEQLAERISQTLQQMAQLQQECQKLEQKQMVVQAKAAISAQQTEHALPYLMMRCDDYDMKSLRLMSDALRDVQPEWMYFLYGIQSQQLQVIVSVPKALQTNVGPAGDWVKQLCTKGGGRPDFAQGGDVAPLDLEQKITQLNERLTCLLS